MPTAKAFTWRDVPAADRDWVRRRTEDIESCAYRTACDMVRIGAALAEVKKKLPKRFAAWLIASTPFTRPTAYRLMATAKSFGPYVSQIETFEPCALYVLAQEKTPQAARDHAVALAEGGKRITRTLALEILDAFAPVAVSATGVKEYESDRDQVMGVQDEQDADTAGMEADDERHAARVGRAFAELVGRSGLLLTATRLDDGETDPVYSVTTHTAADGPRNVFDKELLGALQRAGGTVEIKFCPGCCVAGGDVLRAGEHGPIRPACVPATGFGRDKRQNDLLMTRCGACERSRKRQRRESERARNGSKAK